MASHETAGEVGSKTCPECAEEVKAAALRCRFCGYAFHAEKAAALALSAPPALLSALDEKDARAPTLPATGHRDRQPGLLTRIALAAGGVVLLSAFFLPLLNGCPAGCSARDVASVPLRDGTLVGKPELLLLWTVPIAAALSVVAAWRARGFAPLAAVGSAATLALGIYLGWQIAAASRPALPVHLAVYLALADLGAGYWLLIVGGASTLASAGVLIRATHFVRRDLVRAIAAVAALLTALGLGYSTLTYLDRSAAETVKEAGRSQYRWSDAQISAYTATRKSISSAQASCEAAAFAGQGVTYLDVVAVRVTADQVAAVLKECSSPGVPTRTK